MKNIYLLFSEAERKKILMLLIGILIHGFIEITSIVSILPFMSVVIDPSIIDKNYLLNNLYIFLNLGNHNSFLIVLGFTVFVLMLFSNIYSALIFGG